MKPINFRDRCGSDNFEKYVIGPSQRDEAVQAQRRRNTTRLGLLEKMSSHPVMQRRLAKRLTPVGLFSDVSGHVLGWPTGKIVFQPVRRWTLRLAGSYIE